VDAPDAPIKASAPHTPTTGAAPTSRAPREGTKQAALIDMLSRPEGATLDELATALEWAPHTCRGAMSGALKKRLGLVITSQKVDGRGRVYQIDAPNPV
jgi:predicted ArsR family transcriptional regulator